jgi:hypothetical protein
MTTDTTFAPAVSTDTTTASSRNLEQIKAGIEQTQAHLAETVAELQRKLTWSHLYEETRKTAASTLQSWTHAGLSVCAITMSRAEDLVAEARDRIRRNPAPAALIAAGLAAALWHGARRRRRMASR